MPEEKQPNDLENLESQPDQPVIITVTESASETEPITITEKPADLIEETETEAPIETAPEVEPVTEAEIVQEIEPIIEAIEAVLEEAPQVEAIQESEAILEPVIIAETDPSMTEATAIIIETPEQPEPEILMQSEMPLDVPEEIIINNDQSDQKQMLPVMPSGKIKNSTKIGIAVILILVIAIIYFATRQSDSFDPNTNNQKVSVNDQQQQGKISIIEEVRSDIKVLVDDNDKPVYPKTTITAYFGNTQKNPNSADCNLTYPLEVTIDKKYDANMTNTVMGLLQSVSATAKNQGYVSAIPDGTSLKYIKLDDSGNVEVNFTGNISKAAGSCAVSEIRSQIKSTLMQFASVKTVTICVDGNCKDGEILQP